MLSATKVPDGILLEIKLKHYSIECHGKDSKLAPKIFDRACHKQVLPITTMQF